MYKLRVKYIVMICINLMLKQINLKWKLLQMQYPKKELIIQLLNIVVVSTYLVVREKINKYLMIYGNLRVNGQKCKMINKSLVDLDILLYHTKIQCSYLVDGMVVVVWMICMNILMLLIHFMRFVDVVDLNLKQDIDMKH